MSRSVHPLHLSGPAHLALLVVTAMILAGCTGGTDDEVGDDAGVEVDATADDATTVDEDEDEDEGGRERVESLTVAIPGYENNVTPLSLSFGSFPLTHDMINLVFDTLFWSTADAEPDPWLAESAEPSDDGTAWTVHLRDGVQWHDGEPFDAEDVQFSFEYYKEFESGRYAHHVSEVPLYDRSEIIDPLTIELHFETPTSVFESIPGGDLPILPEHVWSSIEEPSTATEMLPVGTGPFELVEMVPDQTYRFVANDDYFMGEPLVGELTTTVVPDPTAAFAALRTGQVAMAAGRNVPAELLGEFESLEEIEVVEGNRFESFHLYFNVPKEPLSDPQLRRAIDLAIDDQAIVDTVLQGLGRVGRPSFIHPDSPWAIPEDDPAAAARFDLEEAGRILDQAGYVDTDDDGVRETPGGDPLSFEIMGSANEPQDLRTAQLVAQQVDEVGIDLSVLGLDPATVRARRSPAEDGIAPFDIRIGALDTHAHADPDGLLYFFHGGPLGFGNVISGYDNDDFDALAEEAAATADLDDRRELIDQLQGMLSEDVPVITMAYIDGVYAFRHGMYDNWVSDPGHGVFNKRSFLPDQ